MTFPDLGIAPEVLALLRSCRIEGRVAHMPESVPINLHSKVQNALIRLGGHWSATLGGYWFAGESLHFDALISLTQEPDPMTTTLNPAAGSIPATELEPTPEVDQKPETPAEGYGLEHNPSGRMDMILLGDIIESDYNARTAFDGEELAELAADIEINGVLSPILLRPHPCQAKCYEIVAGAKRFRASQIVAGRIPGRDRIPAQILVVSDERAAVMSLAENVKRSQLNPIDLAKGLYDLERRFGWTQTKIASEVGLDQPTVAARLALLDMPASVQAHFVGGSLTATHGKILMSVKDQAACERIAAKAAEGHWSVAMLRDEVSEYQALQRAAAGQTSILELPGVEAPGNSRIEVPSPDYAASYPDAGDADHTEEEETDSHGSDEGEQAEAAEGTDEESLPGDDGGEQEPAEDEASPERDAEPALDQEDDEVVAEAPLPPTSATDGGASSSASPPAAGSTPSAANSVQARASSPSSAAAAPAKAAAAPSNATDKSLQSVIDNLKREIANKDTRIRSLEADVKKLSEPAPMIEGWQNVPVRIEDYEGLAAQGLWPLSAIREFLDARQTAVDTNDTPSAVTGLSLHPVALYYAGELTELVKTTAAFSQPETIILDELFPDREETLPEHIVSVLVTHKFRVANRVFGGTPTDTTPAEESHE